MEDSYTGKGKGGGGIGGAVLAAGAAAVAAGGSVLGGIVNIDDLASGLPQLPF